MRCPDCSSENVSFERSSGYAGFRCGDCGEWHYTKDMKFSPEPREHLKDFEYTQARAMNEYLKGQPENIREKIVETMLEDICIHCFSINSGRCHCTNDE